MRYIGHWVTAFAVAAVWGLAALPAWATEMDLEILVRTARPTTVLPMRYRVLAGNGEDSDATGAGNDGTTPLTMNLRVNTPAAGGLDTPLGHFEFSIAADGSLSVPAGSRLSVSGTTLTIDNDIDLPDFGVRMRNATTLQNIDVSTQVGWQDWRVASTITGGTKTLPGSSATTAVGWPLLGVVPGTRVWVTTTIGAYVAGHVTETGTLVVDPDAADLPATVEAAAPQVFVVENTVDLPDFALRLARPTTLYGVFYFVVSHPYEWRSKAFPGPEGLPGHPLFPGLVYVPGATAHTDECPIPLVGLAPNQSILVVTLLGGESYRVRADGTLAQESIGSRIAWDGPTAVIQNTLDIPGLRIRLRNPTNATTVRMHVQVGAWISTYLGSTESPFMYVAGSEADDGIGFPMMGVVPDLLFYVATPVASFGWLSTTAEGGVAFAGAPDPTVGPGSPPIVRAEAVPGGPHLVIENPVDVRCRVYGETPISDVDVWSSVYFDYAFSPIDPGPYGNQFRACDGTDWPTGVEFVLRGMGLHQTAGASSIFGPNNPRSVGFTLHPDGTATFNAPTRQVTPWKGALDIDVDRDGTMDNVMYVEFAPLNRAPTATLSTGNFTIPSTAQATTVVSATVADADGNPLTCRWYVDDVLASGPSAPDEGATSLDLGALGPLAVGDHTIRLEVSDGELAAMPSIVLTVENSPPVVTASGSGVFEIGSATSVTLGGAVSDHDGDEVTYAWLLDGVAVPGASGTVATTSGGAPVAVPPCSLGTTAIGIGTHTLTLVVEDELNEPVSSSVTVEVKDTTGPTLEPVASTRMLWPPNHEMVDVTIAANALDASGGAVTLAVAVTSDEPVEFDGTGRFLPDHEVVSIDPATGAIRLRLRAERSGGGDGRTYTVVITATDAVGNVSTATVVVKAPHDRKSR